MSKVEHTITVRRCTRCPFYDGEWSACLAEYFGLPSLLDREVDKVPPLDCPLRDHKVTIVLGD